MLKARFEALRPQSNTLSYYVYLMAFKKSTDVGFTSEAKKCVNCPCSFTKYLQKFQLGSFSFQPFSAFDVSHWYKGDLSLPFTDTFSKTGNVTP